MKYRVQHTTIYEYALPVSQCHNLAYLLPRNTDRQRVENIQIKTLPDTSHRFEHLDYFGNRFIQFAIEKDHTRLELTVTSEVEIKESNQNTNLDFGTPCAYAKYLLHQHQDWASICAREFLLNSPLIAQHQDFADYAQDCFADDQPFLSAVMALTRKIYQEFQFDPEFSDVATPIADVLKHKRGVCQDFAQLAIACVRSLGFPAAYVSGYLETLPPAGQTKLIGADASHAWFAVYSPGEGWFEFDPTNNQMVNDKYITTAWGRDYSDVTPLKGVIFGGGHSPQLTVAVDVTSVQEDMIQSL